MVHNERAKKDVTRSETERKPHAVSIRFFKSRNFEERVNYGNVFRIEYLFQFAENTSVKKNKIDETETEGDDCKTGAPYVSNVHEINDDVNGGVDMGGANEKSNSFVTETKAPQMFKLPSYDTFAIIS
jgi:hypothetical protein